MKPSDAALASRDRKLGVRQREVQWYAATLVFSSSIAREQSLRPLCEERTVLFAAKDESTARSLAVAHGLAEEHSYRNARAEPVTWRFVGIDRVEAVPPDVSGRGWEVASRYARRSLKKLRALEKTARR